MIRISEWLPNPAGKDKGSEWIELMNEGDVPVSLAGWKISAGSEKKISLPARVVAPHDYVLLTQNNIPFTLRNTDGFVVLYGPDGREKERGEFQGVAPEGKSANRLGERFTFRDPTPLAVNKVVVQEAALYTTIPEGVMTSARGTGELLFLAIGFAALTALAAVVFIRTNETLSELFFA